MQPQYPNRPDQPQQPHVPLQPTQNYTPPAPPPQPQQQFDPNTSQPAVSGPQPHDYSFLIDSTPVPRQSILGGASKMGRMVVVGLAVFGVLAVLVIIKTIISSGGNIQSASLLGVIQDQQVLIHLSTSAAQIQTASSTTINSASTIQLAITSDQTKLLAYLKSNGVKVDSKEAGLKIKPSVDTELTTANSDGVYDQTYQSVLHSSLSTYSQDLKVAYSENKGVKGRALLKAQFGDAQLLLKQLDAPANSSD